MNPVVTDHHPHRPRLDLDFTLNVEVTEDDVRARQQRPRDGCLARVLCPHGHARPAGRGLELELSIGAVADADRFAASAPTALSASVPVVTAEQRP